MKYGYLCLIGIGCLGLYLVTQQADNPPEIESEVAPAVGKILPSILSCDFDRACVEQVLEQAGVLPPSELLDLRLQAGLPLAEVWPEIEPNYLAQERYEQGDIVPVLIKHNELAAAKEQLVRLSRGSGSEPRESLYYPNFELASPLTDGALELLVFTEARRDFQQRLKADESLRLLAQASQDAQPNNISVTLLSTKLAYAGRWGVYVDWFHGNKRTEFMSDASAAAQSGELNRAAFLAFIAPNTIFRHDRLQRVLDSIVYQGWRPVCFEKNEQRAFLVEGRWPDLDKPRALCLDLITALKNPADVVAVLLRAYDRWRSQPEGEVLLGAALQLLQSNRSASGLGSTASRLNLYLDDGGTKAQEFVASNRQASDVTTDVLKIEQRDIEVLVRLAEQGGEAALTGSEVVGNIVQVMKNAWITSTETRGAPVSVTPLDEVQFAAKLMELNFVSESELAELLAVSLMDAVFYEDADRFTILRQFVEKSQVDLNRKEVFDKIEAAADDLTNAKMTAEFFTLLTENQPMKADWFHMQRPLNALWKHRLCEHLERALQTEAGETIISYSNFSVLRSWLLSVEAGCWGAVSPGE